MSEVFQAFMDPAVEAGVTRALGPGRWSSERLREFRGALHIRGAESLVGLSMLPKVEEITLDACTLSDLSPLLFATGLRVLRLRRSPIVSLEGLSGFRSLVRFEIIGALVRDLTPVLDCAALQQVDIHGLPLDWDSQANLLLPLMTLPRPMTGLVPIGSVQSADTGLRARRLVKLGWTLADAPCGDWFALRLGSDGPPAVLACPMLVVLRALRDPSLTSEIFVTKLLAEGCREVSLPEHLGRSYGLARFHDARARVSESSLPEPDKDWLLAFLSRFPDQISWWENDVEVDRANAGHDAPGALRQYRTTLAMIVPGFIWHVRFRSFQLDLLGVRDRADGIFYEIAPNVNLGRELRPRFEAERLRPIGLDPDGGPVLVYDADRPEDRRIWAVSPDELPLRSTLAPAFASYAAMLGHVNAVEIEGRARIYANDTPEATSR